MSASDWGKEFPSFAKLFNGRLSLKSGYIWSTEMTSKFSTFPWEAWRLKPGTHSQLSQHSFDNNHYSAYYRDLKTQERNKEVPRAQREDAFDKTAHCSKQTIAERTGKKIFFKSATFGLILRLRAGEMFPKVLHGMSVSNKCAPSEFDYLIAPWSFLQESQRQDNNTTESQKNTAM